MDSFTRNARKKTRKNLERNITHALFMAPNLILYTVFTVFPIFLGIYYSATDWNGISKHYDFIGMKNYVNMFSDARFIRAIMFNGKYVILLMAGILSISLLIALLLNQKIRMIGFFRSAFFFPAVIGMISIALIFNQLYGHGLPLIGKILGIEVLKENILSSPKLAFLGILFLHIWQGVCIPTVIILAGLQTIPNELFEAAKIDGGNRYHRFKYITLPFLIPSISMVLVLSLKDGLMVYDYILALTNGGPAGSTESLTMLVMKEAFEELKFSYAISQAMVIALFIIVISVIQINVLGKKKVY